MIGRIFLIIGCAALLALAGCSANGDGNGNGYIPAANQPENVNGPSSDGNAPVLARPELPPPPTARVLNLTLPMGITLKPTDFVSDLSDNTSVVFIEEPNIFVSGERAVNILLENNAGLTTELTARLTLEPNVIPPVITGTRNIEIRAGENIMLRHGVSAHDAFGRELEFEVDRGNLNLDVPGHYTVTYIARDEDGLYTTAQITVYVLDVDIDWIYEQVEVIFSRIFREDMTQTQQARAIFDWIGGHISYAADIGRNTVYEGAFQALRNRQGNCFIFYAIAEVMFTHAGIPNRRVSRVGGFANHVWNIINPDGMGWVHFDSTPIRGNPVDRFMFTNAQAAEFTETILRTNNVRNYYVFDETLFYDIVWYVAADGE